ncbi:MAG: hypothetical protein V8S13_09285 [Gemmiger formicilis]
MPSSIIRLYIRVNTAMPCPQLTDGEILAQLTLVDFLADCLAQCPRQLDHILMVGAQVSQRCAAAQIARVAAELFCQQILQFFKGHSVFPLSLGSFVFLSYKPTAVPSRGKPATTAQIYCA